MRWRGKLRVRVQGDDVADVGKDVERASFYGEAVLLVQEKFIEVEELAAFALPAHPGRLGES